MKLTKILTMVAVALIMAACSSEDDKFFLNPIVEPVVSDTEYLSGEYDGDSHTMVMGRIPFDSKDTVTIVGATDTTLMLKWTSSKWGTGTFDNVKMVKGRVFAFKGSGKVQKVNARTGRVANTYQCELSGSVTPDKSIVLLNLSIYGIHNGKDTTVVKFTWRNTETQATTNVLETIDWSRVTGDMVIEGTHQGTIWADGYGQKGIIANAPGTMKVEKQRNGKYTLTLSKYTYDVLGYTIGPTIIRNVTLVNKRNRKVLAASIPFSGYKDEQSYDLSGHLDALIFGGDRIRAVVTTYAGSMLQPLVITFTK